MTLKKNVTTGTDEWYEEENKRQEIIDRVDKENKLDSIMKEFYYDPQIAYEKRRNDIEESKKWSLISVVTEWISEHYILLSLSICAIVIYFLIFTITPFSIFILMLIGIFLKIIHIDIKKTNTIMKTCSCGARLDGDTKICSNCGHRFVDKYDID